MKKAGRRRWGEPPDQLLGVVSFRRANGRESPHSAGGRYIPSPVSSVRGRTREGTELGRLLDVQGEELGTLLHNAELQRVAGERPQHASVRRATEAPVTIR